MGNSINCSANKRRSHVHDTIINQNNSDKLLPAIDLKIYRPYNDLKTTITEVISFMGRYQMAICLAFILNGFIYGINHNLTAFHVYTPAFYCEVMIRNFFV